MILFVCIHISFVRVIKTLCYYKQTQNLGSLKQDFFIVHVLVCKAGSSSESVWGPDHFLSLPPYLPTYLYPHRQLLAESI